LARGVRAAPGGAGLFGASRRCSFSWHQRAVGLRSPSDPELRLLPSSEGAGQCRTCMEEGSAAAGTPPGTTAAREPTVGCDVACSECMAKCVAEVGAAGGSAVEGFMDAVVLIVVVCVVPSTRLDSTPYQDRACKCFCDAQCTSHASLFRSSMNNVTRIIFGGQRLQGADNVDKIFWGQMFVFRLNEQPINAGCRQCVRYVSIVWTTDTISAPEF